MHASQTPVHELGWEFQEVVGEMTISVEDHAAVWKVRSIGDKISDGRRKPTKALTYFLAAFSTAHLIRIAQCPSSADRQVDRWREV